MPANAQQIMFGPDSQKSFWSQPIDSQIKQLSAIAPDKTKDLSRGDWQKIISKQQPKAKALFGDIGKTPDATPPPAQKTQPPASAPVSSPPTAAPIVLPKSIVQDKTTPPPATEKPTAPKPAAKPEPSWMDKALGIAKDVIDKDVAFYSNPISSIGGIGRGIADAAKAIPRAVDRIGHAATRAEAAVEGGVDRASHYLSTEKGQQAAIDTAKAALNRFGDIGDAAFSVEGGAVMAALAVAPELGPVGVTASRLLGAGLSVAQVSDAVKSLITAADKPTPENVGNAITDLAVVGPILAEIKALKGDGSGILDYLKGKLTGKSTPEVTKLKDAVSSAVGTGGKPDSKWFHDAPIPIKEETTKVPGTEKLFKTPPSAKAAVEAGTPQAIKDYVMQGDGSGGEHKPAAITNNGKPATPPNTEGEEVKTAKPDSPPDTDAAARAELEKLRAENAKLRGGEPPSTDKSKVVPISTTKNRPTPPPRTYTTAEKKATAAAISREVAKKSSGLEVAGKTGGVKNADEIEAAKVETPIHADTHREISDVITGAAQSGIGKITIANESGATTEVDLSKTTKEDIDRAARELGESKELTITPTENTKGLKAWKRSVETDKSPAPAAADSGLPQAGTNATAKANVQGVYDGDVVKYVGAKPGGLHVVEDEDGRKVYLSGEDFKKLFGGEVPNPELPAVAQPESTPKVVDVTAKLPDTLAGARPKYRTFGLNFKSDIDRAAYITAQAKRSKADAEYLKFVMDATGMTEAEVRSYGDEVREEIKKRESRADDGYISIPNLAQKRFAPKEAKVASQ